MRGELHPTREQENADAAAEPLVDSAALRRSRQDGRLPDDEPLGPSGPLTRRNMVFALLFILAAVVGLYFLVPKFAGLNQTWGRLRRGNATWLAAAAGLEVLSVASYAVLFRTVFARGLPRLSWRASIEIPLAGIAAIRLLAAAGAGGVAVTVWALRRAGMAPRLIACRMAANYSIQYSLYLLALIVGGLGLYTGVFAGQGPVALTLLPAIFSAVALGLGAAMGLVPGDFERRLEHLSRRRGPDRAAGHALCHAARDARVGRAHRARADPGAACGPARRGGLLGLRYRGAGRCRSRRSARPCRWPCWSWATSSARWAACFRSPAGSAAWRAG